MKKISGFLLALTLPAGAIAAGAQPAFATLARSGPQPNLGTSPATKPSVTKMPAPRVSEMRAVPGADGELHVVCREVPNPKLAPEADHAEHDTP